MNKTRSSWLGILKILFLCLCISGTDITLLIYIVDIPSIKCLLRRI